jgi:hypothetical protein
VRDQPGVGRVQVGEPAALVAGGQGARPVVREVLRGVVVESVHPGSAAARDARMGTLMRDDDNDRDNEGEGSDERRADGRGFAVPGHRSRLQVTGIDVCARSEG